MSCLWLTPKSPTSDPPHQAWPQCPVYILLPLTRPDSCNGHRKVSNALPKPDRSHLHSGSYTSAVPNQTHPLLLGLARSCSLCFGFPTRQCVQSLNSRCTVVNIFLTSELSLFHPDRQGELVITVTQLLSPLQSLKSLQLLSSFSHSVSSVPPVPSVIWHCNCNNTKCKYYSHYVYFILFAGLFIIYDSFLGFPTPCPTFFIELTYVSLCKIFCTILSIQTVVTL